MYVCVCVSTCLHYSENLVLFCFFFFVFSFILCPKINRCTQPAVQDPHLPPTDTVRSGAAVDGEAVFFGLEKRVQSEGWADWQIGESLDLMLSNELETWIGAAALLEATTTRV